MIEILSYDLNVIQRWTDILKDYDIKEVDTIQDISDRKMIIADLSSCSKRVFNFLKSNPKHNIDFILLESVPKVEIAKRVLSLGAKAYGNTYMLPVHLISCIETVKNGHVWVYPEFTYVMIQNIHQEENQDELFQKDEILTKREQEITKEVLNGLNNPQIAQKLEISERTVKVHLSNIFQKLHVSNRFELALYFR